MKSQNTNLKIIVGNATTAPSETTLPAFVAGASEGEVRVVSQDGTAAASGTPFAFLAIKNGKLDRSEVIDPAGVLKVSALAYVAPTERVEYVGYNGTAGAIDVIPNNLYQVNVELFNYGSLSTENRYLRAGYYESTAMVTQELVAQGVVASLIRNVSRERLARFKAERVNSNAGAVLTNTGDITVTKGSKTISAATNIDALLVVGDYIRVGTAVTDPVYKVVAINATADTATLDMPYQGETAVLDDTTDAQRITEANALAANFGIKISGLPQDFDRAKLRFEPVDYRVTLVDFGTTDITVASGATKGRGDGRTVAEEEWFAEGNFGEINRRGPEPHLYSPEYVANPPTNYHVISMLYQHTEQPAFVTTKSPRMINVYINATNTTAVNAIITDLATIGLSVSTL